MNTVAYDLVLNELRKTYVEKNKCYGNSFDITLDKYGLVGAMSRINDKFHRLDTLTQDDSIDTIGESVFDTMLDMANYLIMTLAYYYHEFRRPGDDEDYSDDDNRQEVAYEEIVKAHPEHFYENNKEPVEHSEEKQLMKNDEFKKICDILKKQYDKSTKEPIKEIIEEDLDKLLDDVLSEALHFFYQAKAESVEIDPSTIDDEDDENKDSIDCIEDYKRFYNWEENDPYPSDNPFINELDNGGQEETKRFNGPQKIEDLKNILIDTISELSNAAYTYRLSEINGPKSYKNEMTDLSLDVLDSAIDLLYFVAKWI